jgi:hypothetical protein
MLIAHLSFEMNFGHIVAPRLETVSQLTFIVDAIIVGIHDC